MASRVAASLLLLGSRVSAGVVWPLAPNACVSTSHVALQVMPGDYEEVLAKLARGNSNGKRSMDREPVCVPISDGFANEPSHHKVPGVVICSAE